MPAGGMARASWELALRRAPLLELSGLILAVIQKPSNWQSADPQPDWLLPGFHSTWRPHLLFAPTGPSGDYPPYTL